MTKLLNARQLEEYLGISRHRAYQLMHNRSFPAIKLGGRFYVSVEAVEEWERNNRCRQFILRD